MKNILDIRVQKLFLVTLVLKVSSSFLGWRLQDPWIFGFTVPLIIMVVYIVLGTFRNDRDVSDEKFADSCYYLGFIFTITSIIFSLFDLPNIGTRIQEIAVRFGAAMVSTVLGLGVRVYMVSFRKEMADAIQDAEDAVIDSSRRFTEQLVTVLERLRDFESQVDMASRTSVERVNLQIEKLSKDHSEKLSSFFTDLTARNQEAFTLALDDVKSATKRLADSVDGYSQGMRTNLTSIDLKIGAFTTSVTDRLKSTTFPDDYFAQHLHAPLTQLKESSAALAKGIHSSAQEVTESTIALSTALKKFKSKAGSTEDSLETVLKLSQQQQLVLQSAQGQLSALESLAITLAKFETTLAGTASQVAASSDATLEIADRLSSTIIDSSGTRNALEGALSAVIENLRTQVDLINSVASRMDENSATTRSAGENISGNLAAATAANEQVSVNLAAVVGASRSIAEQLQVMIRQLTDLDNVRSAGSAPVPSDIISPSARDLNLTDTLAQNGGPG